MEAIARTVANRLLHEPTLQMKRAGGDRVHARVGLLRELFGLEDVAERAQEPADDAAGADVRELRRRGR
jgi:glutamyl-tRNA reductase